MNKDGAYVLDCHDRYASLLGGLLYRIPDYVGEQFHSREKNYDIPRV